MLPAVVHVDPDARVGENVLVGVAKIAGASKYVAREVGDVDTFNGRMERRGLRGVADAKPDHQHARGGRHRQERDMRQRAHVALVEQRGRRHRVPVGDEAAAPPRHLRHADDFGDPFAKSQQPLAFRRSGQRAPQHVVRRQPKPQNHGDGRNHHGNRSRHGGRGRHASARARSQVERRDRQRGGDRERRRAPLHAESRQQHESGHERTADGARRVGEVQRAGAAADRALRVLNHRISQRKRAAHQKRGNAEFGQHRPRVVPELSDPARERRQARQRHVDGTSMGVERLDARPSKPRQRRDHQQRLHHHQGLSRLGGPSIDVAAEQRSGADAHEHDREDERKHGTETAKEQREVAEPDDLQAHRREAAQHERKARPGDRVEGLRHAGLFSKADGSPGSLSRRCRSPGQHERAGAGNQVQEHRDELRVRETQRRYQREIREEGARRRAGGIDGVQHGDLPAAGALHVVPDTVPNQQRQRAAHQDGARPEQPEGNHTAHDVRQRRQLEPARRIPRVGRRHGRDNVEAGERDRNRHTEAGDDELDDAIHAEQRFGRVLIASIGPSPDDDASAAEAEHEDGDDEGRGLDRGAEDVPEFPDPDDLVNEAADP